MDLELQTTDIPVKVNSLTKDLGIKIEKGVDIREGAEWREIASQMELSDSVGGLSDADAAKLARAIDACHGERTGSVRERDGAFRVWRTEPRPVRTRAKKVVGGPMKKAKAEKPHA